MSKVLRNLEVPYFSQRENRTVVNIYYREDIVDSKTKKIIHKAGDFRGGQGTDVVSLVYGEIICFGSSVSMGGIVLMRARFDTSLYYLAVHLDETSFSNLKENKKISPGDRIAKIGSYDSRGTHLHVSAIKLPEGVPPIGEGANKYKSATYKENGIWKFPTWGQESIYRSKMKNPFDYNSSDYWAGFTLKK